MSGTLTQTEPAIAYVFPRVERKRAGGTVATGFMATLVCEKVKGKENKRAPAHGVGSDSKITKGSDRHFFLLIHIIYHRLNHMSILQM